MDLILEAAVVVEYLLSLRIKVWVVIFMYKQLVITSACILSTEQM